MNFLKEMIDLGELNLADPIEKSCLQYCFLSLLQRDLDDMKRYWKLAFHSEI